MKKNNDFSLEFPLGRTHCGMPLGNGNMGVLVWGRENLHLTVSRSDFWDRRDGDVVMPGQTYRQFAEALKNKNYDSIRNLFVRREHSYTMEKHGIGKKSMRLPVGRFEFELKENCKLKKAVLDYASGSVSVWVESPAGKVELKLIQHLKRNILLLEDPAGVIVRIIPRPAWEWVGKEFAKIGMKPPIMVDEGILTGWINECPDDPALAVLCAKNGRHLAVSLELGNNAKDAKAAAEKELAAVNFKETEDLNCRWWKNYWKNCPKVSLPDDFFNRFMKFAHYKFACATHPFSSIPSGLQGPWVEEYHPAPWSADYHFNVNIQQIYTLAFAGGKCEHLLPLFDMLESESFRTIMRDNAKNLFGIDDGLLLTHAVDDKGRQCGGISIGAVLDHACGGWTALLYWWYYEYTQDKDFLRRRAYPFMYGIMRVYEEMLEEYEGRLSIPVSISAEYSTVIETEKGPKVINYGRDPSYQLACMHKLLDALLNCCKILELPPRPSWAEIKRRTPEFSVIGSSGEERIAVWEGFDLALCHRHHSHLGCIYPFDSITEMTEQKLAIINNSIDHWIKRGMGEWSEWCYPWAAIIQARMGFREAPLLLLKIWKEIFINEGLATAYLPKFRGLTAHRRLDMLKPKETNEIMQLDGTMAGATALYEMLLHCKNGTVYIFPAVHPEWKNISFNGIAVPGAFRVSAEMKRGVVENIKVKSLVGGTIKLSIPESLPMVLSRHKKIERIKFPLTLELTKGETAVLKPDIQEPGK